MPFMGPLISAVAGSFLAFSMAMFGTSFATPKVVNQADKPYVTYGSTTS
jgi:hypothetical protein